MALPTPLSHSIFCNLAVSQFRQETYENIINGDMYQFDSETNETHDQETDSDSSRNLEKFCEVSPPGSCTHLSQGTREKSTLFIGLSASVNEEHALFDKIPWDIEKFCDLV
jgi:hypothetical protein